MYAHTLVVVLDERLEKVACAAITSLGMKLTHLRNVDEHMDINNLFGVELAHNLHRPLGAFDVVNILIVIVRMALDWPFRHARLAFTRTVNKYALRDVSERSLFKGFINVFAPEE